MAEREKEQAEQGMFGLHTQWLVFRDIVTQLNAMTDPQWNAVWDQVQTAQPGTAEVTRLQAITFVTTRRDAVFVELAVAMNTWRLA